MGTNVFNDIKQEKVKEIRMEKANDIRDYNIKDIRKDKDNNVRKEKVNNIRKEKVNDISEENFSDIRRERAKDIREDNVTDIKNEEDNNIRIDTMNEEICEENNLYKLFREEPLEMIKIIRISAEEGISIDSSEIEAMKKLSHNIKNIEKEELREEFEKILLSNPRKIDDLVDTGLLEYIMPELNACVGVNQQNPYHCFDVYNHIISTVCNIDEERDLRMAMVLHDIAKPQCKTVDAKGVGHFYGHADVSTKKARDILQRLKYDDEIIDRIALLVKYHDRQIANTKKSVRKLLRLVGEEMFLDLLKVKRADILGQSPELAEKRLEDLEDIKVTLKEVIEHEKESEINNKKSLRN